MSSNRGRSFRGRTTQKDADEEVHRGQAKGASKTKRQHHMRRAVTGTVQQKTSENASRTKCTEKHARAEFCGRQQASARQNAKPQWQAERTTTSATTTITTQKKTRIPSNARQRDKRTGTKTSTCKRLQRYRRSAARNIHTGHSGTQTGEPCPGAHREHAGTSSLCCVLG